jgi:hypothetical protein
MKWESQKEMTIADGDTIEVHQFEGTVGKFGIEGTVKERRTGKEIMFQMELEEAKELAEHILWIVSKGHKDIDILD